MKKALFVLLLGYLNLSVYAQAVKLPPITPRWALEHIVWEDSANTQVASMQLVKGYLDHQMPVGAIIIDSPWSNAYNDFDWDTKRYPDPNAMIKTFQKQDVKVILWLTGCINLNGKDVPLQKNPYFDEAVAKKYVVNNGKTSKWWKGDGLHLDFTNPEAVKWWNAKLDKVVVDGVYGFKVDQGEIYFGDTLQTSVGPLTNEAFRPYYYNSMFRYITGKKAEGAILGRPFSHQGGVEASVEKLSLGWCGDFQGDWAGLKLQIDNIYKSAALGYGAPGCEVGGFWNARSTAKELVRYAQFGAMTATMVNGGENGAFTNHLPWYHGTEVEKSYRQAVWLHTELVPYLFSTLVQAHKTGGSLLRNCSPENESHQVGDFLFTKVITSEDDHVSFLLPEGNDWMEFWSKTMSHGGWVIGQTYPLDEFPLFVRAGSIIPMNISNAYSGIGDASLKGKQSMYIVPRPAKFDYFYYRPLSDGIDYEQIHLSYDNGNILVEGKTELPYAFLVQQVDKPVKVTNADKWSYDAARRELRILKSGSSFTVRVVYPVKK
jgi:alpha-glucosidase (family GH31 glycosyl hydrolase)